MLHVIPGAIAEENMLATHVRLVCFVLGLLILTWPAFVLFCLVALCVSPCALPGQSVEVIYVRHMCRNETSCRKNLRPLVDLSPRSTVEFLTIDIFTTFRQRRMSAHDLS